MAQRTSLAVALVLVLVLVPTAGATPAGGSVTAADCGTGGNLPAAVAPYDADGNQVITIPELGTAAAAYAADSISISDLGRIASLYARGPPNTTVNGTTGTVTDVVDGDTLDIQYANGTADTVRLIGVDTPEVHTSTDPAEFEGVPTSQAGRAFLSGWGDNASAFAKRVVSGATVTLCPDSQTDRRGSFGRLLAYVQVNQSMTLNRVLVERGYARVYTASDFSKESAYLSLETTAQAADRGVWGYTGDGNSSDGNAPDGNQSGPLAVTAIHADAAGNDHTNLTGEWITITNTGSTSLDLTGYEVSDAASHTYQFPDGFTLAAGTNVTLYTGSGTDTDTELYWGAGSAVWNNGGDTVTIRNQTGAVVAEKDYW